MQFLCSITFINVLEISSLSHKNVRVSWWHTGLGIGLTIKRSSVRLVVNNDYEQLVHTLVSLSPSTMI